MATQTLSSRGSSVGLIRHFVTLGASPSLYTQCPWSSVDGHRYWIMKVRLQDLEAKVRDPEQKFSTPEGSQKQEAETTKEPRGSKEAETTKDQRTGPEAEASTSAHQEPRSDGSGSLTEKFMLLMMESMKEMQKKYLESKDEAGMVRGVEVVRSGAPELPPLPAWNPTQGPLQLGDWLLLLEPLVADMSATSELWWSLMSTAAEQWYHKHTALSPLDRIQHQASPPSNVQLDKWQRLERRMSAMLLQSIPEMIRDELVASRRLSVFGILTHLYTVYCPGGVYEKQTLLKSLEEPAEVTSLAEAPAAIRKWLRWRRRTEEIGAVAPDPALLLKGLNRLTRKVIEPNKELQFRISMVRNSLGVDTTPTAVTVGHFATHLLAEIEQVALTEKRSAPATRTEAPKLKAFEVYKTDKGRVRTSEKQAEESTGKPRCKFYLRWGWMSEGKAVHLLSRRQRREKTLLDMWRCGSHGIVMHKTQVHLSWEQSHKAEGHEDRGGGEDTFPKGDRCPVFVTFWGVNEGAHGGNRMLRSLSSSGGAPSPPTSPTSKEEDAKTELMEKLQQQLNSMKLKTLRLGRMSTEGSQGLIDSGATNPLRPKRCGERIEHYKKLEVSLADGTTTRLPVSPGGAMVSANDNTEPIVPMHQLTGLLGCEVIKMERPGVGGHSPRSWEAACSALRRLSTGNKSTCHWPHLGDWGPSPRHWHWEEPVHRRRRLDEEAGTRAPSTQKPSVLDSREAGGIPRRMVWAAAKQKDQEKVETRRFCPPPLCRRKRRVQLAESLQTGWRRWNRLEEMKRSYWRLTSKEVLSTTCSVTPRCIPVFYEQHLKESWRRS